MTITLNKTHVHEGTRLSQSVVDALNDRAVKTIYLNSDAASVNNEKDAIDWVVANDGGVFPDTTLPLNQVSVQSLHDGKLRATLFYGREYAGFDPTTANDKRAVMRAGIVNIPWYLKPYSDGSLGPPIPGVFSGGRPAGDINMEIVTGDGSAIQSKRPVPWLWPVRVLYISVPFVVTTNPTDIVFPQLDTVNSDAITWGDESFAANVLRFDGFDVDWYDVNGTDTYIGYYHFTARRDGWVTQMLRDNSAAVAVDTVDMYERVSFTSPGFPI